MFNLTEYIDKNKRLSDLLPWAFLVDPSVVLNKDGSFTSVIMFRGPDLDSSTETELLNVRARLNNILKRFGSNWCIHVEARRHHAQQYPRSEFPDQVTALIDIERRQAFEEEGSHFDNEHYLSITYLLPSEKIGKIENLLFEGMESEKGVDYGMILQRFKEQVGGALSMLEPIMPELELLAEGRLLRYLHNCVSDRFMDQVAMPPLPFYLDEMITDAPLVGGLSPKLGAKFLKTVSVRSYAPTTSPCFLDALNRLPMEYRWVVRYIPMDKSLAQKVIGKRKDTWFNMQEGIKSIILQAIFKYRSNNVNKTALLMSQDADEALQELGFDAVSYGYLTLTVTVWDEDLEEATRKAQRVQQICDSQGLVTEIEQINAVDAWLGSIPGHTAADMRRPMLSSLSFSDLIPASAVWSGPKANDHLGGPVLMHTKTAGSTPFRLNLNISDVGHTFVVGPTGSGKSTLLCILAAQFRRYPGAQVYFFDMGRSSRALTHAAGGDFYELGPDVGQGGLSFQPLARIDDEAERIWAWEWLTEILEMENVTIDPKLRDELWSCLANLSSHPRQHRTISALLGLLQHEQAKDALKAYTKGGAYGYLLDSDHDSLSYGSWQSFEMESLIEKKKVVLPVLNYMFHRLDERFGAIDEDTETVRPTILVLDEVWRFLLVDQFRDKIMAWLKVLRKRAVYVVFATQNLADIEKSEISAAIKENMPTRIYLPNPKAMEPSIMRVYEEYGLNEQQVRLLSMAIAKQDYYYSSQLGNRLFEIGFESFALAFCGSSRPEDHALMDEIFQKYGERGREYFAWYFLKGLGRDEYLHLVPEPPEKPTPKEALMIV